MIFKSVYRTRGSIEILYELLAERQPYQSISHRAMPTRAEHENFVLSMPYISWMLMEDEGITQANQADQRAGFVGSVYVSKRHEVGIFVFKRHIGRGYGGQALEWVRRTFKGERLLANVNPDNFESIEFFTKHGAKLIQNTYEV